LAVQTVAPSAAVVAAILDSDEVAALVAELDELRWTGRKGYGARALVGAWLVKSLYAIPTWTRVASLLADHRALADAIGGTPSAWACYRFGKKLRENKPLLDACLVRVAASLRAELPQLGENIAIDASDLPAYGNGQRFIHRGGPERKRFSDPDASWGHRSAVSTRSGGGYYGYKLHAAVCVATGLPLAWRVESARVTELQGAMPLLDSLRERGFAPETCAADKGYDYGPYHKACMERGILPVTAERRMGKAGPSRPPECEHGRLDVRRCRLQAQGNQVALPDERVQARLQLGQGRPPQPARPPLVQAVRPALRGPRRRRARVRPLEE
jgi:hypothetical protein